MEQFFIELRATDKLDEASGALSDDVWQSMKSIRPTGFLQFNGSLAAGWIGSRFLRDTALEYEVAPLIAKYPEHWTLFKADFDSRRTLENMAKCNSPGAKELLQTIDRRAFMTSFSSVFCGALLNLAVDKLFFSSSPYGEACFSFDTLGVAGIACLPLNLRPRYAIPIKTMAIVAGHVGARILDRQTSTEKPYSQTLKNNVVPEQKYSFVASPNKMLSSWERASLQRSARTEIQTSNLLRRISQPMGVSSHNVCTEKPYSLSTPVLR